MTALCKYENCKYDVMNIRGWGEEIWEMTLLMLPQRVKETPPKTERRM